MAEKLRYVLVSGYFNPIHFGHIKLFMQAKKLGDKLIVIVNNDKQQILKKGKIIMDEIERINIVKSIRYVDKAVLSIDSDPTIIKALEKTFKNIKAKDKHSVVIFANGGDRKKGNIPEYDFCKNNNIIMKFGIGGNDKHNSSTNIFKKAEEFLQ